MRPDAAGYAEASTEELVEAAYLALGELASRPEPDPSVLGRGLVLMDQAEELYAALDLGHTAFACWVRAVERSKVVRDRRFSSVKTWLKQVCGMRSGQAEGAVVTGRQLERLPLVGERLKAGKLSYPLGATIAEAVQRLDDEDCAKAEELMLGWAEEGRSATEIAHLGVRIKERIAERDGTEQPPEDSRRKDEQSWWRLSKSPDGSSFVKGRFTPELTALVLDQLTRLAAPAGPDDTRDHSERMADALGMYLAGGGSNWNATLIIRLDPDTGKPTAMRKPDPRRPDPREPGSHEPGSREGIVFDPEPRFRFTDAPPPGPAQAPGPGPATPGPGESDSDGHNNESVTEPGCTEPRFDEPRSDEPGSDGSDLRSGRPADDRGTVLERVEAAGSVPNWPLEDARITARLADGTPVSAEQARIIAFNAGVSVLLLDSEGVPLYLGDKTRFFSPAQRRVIEALYGTCAFVGCDVPARGCQLDHVHNWSEGGLTDIDMAAPCCAWHNRLKYRHPEDIEITRDSRGRWQYKVTRPGWRHWRTHRGRSP